MKILPLFGLIVVVMMIVAAYWPLEEKFRDCPYGPVVMCEHRYELPPRMPVMTWPRP